jgi:hypothetical protein
MSATSLPATSTVVKGTASCEEARQLLCEFIRSCTQDEGTNTYGLGDAEVQALRAVRDAVSAPAGAGLPCVALWCDKFGCAVLAAAHVVDASRVLLDVVGPDGWKFDVASATQRKHASTAGQRCVRLPGFPSRSTRIVRLHRRRVPVS